MSKSRLIEVLRWVMLLPTTVFGFYIAFLLGVVTFVVANDLCPSEFLVSGHCVAPHMELTVKISYIVYPSLAGVLVILFAHSMAPNYKLQSAVLAFILGSAVALYIGLPHQWPSVICTILCSLVLLLRYFRLNRGYS